MCCNNFHIVIFSGCHLTTAVVFSPLLGASLIFPSSGRASVTEALVNECQTVLLPGPYSDHVINARILGRKLKVGVEVEQGEEDGLFSKESVCKAVKIVMDDGNEVGREIRDNHTKVRNLLLAPNFESSCLDDFILRLQDML
ncbi:Anthocyanidin 3-O-glucoside 2''-O-glucosyltransferase [Arachis hypogaea]|nr:Anthocyanidin 3-O-glucoside 2''-O-glucosyltransferase [Arachis hypogaea]